jgi:hypothetical protein
MKIFRQIFSILQFKDDKLKDIIELIQRIDFSTLYTDEQIKELIIIRPEVAYTPIKEELDSILLILKKILGFIKLTSENIPLIIERLQMELTKIKNLNEIFDIILSQIKFTVAEFDTIINRLKFKSVKTDFTEEEIIGIIIKLNIRIGEEKQKAIAREPIVAKAREIFKMIIEAKQAKAQKEQAKAQKEQDIAKIEAKKKEKLRKSIKDHHRSDYKINTIQRQKEKLRKSIEDHHRSDYKINTIQRQKERDEKQGFKFKYFKYKDKYLKLKNELNI